MRDELGLRDFPHFPLFFSVLCIKFDGAVFSFFCERNCISRRDCTRVEEENVIQIHITKSKTVEVIRSHNQKKLYLHFCTWALKDLRVSGWLEMQKRKKQYRIRSGFGKNFDTCEGHLKSIPYSI